MGTYVPYDFGIQILRQMSISICKVYKIQRYRQTLNIRRAKSQNLNVSRVVLQVSLLYPLDPGIKLRMKM